MHGLRRSAALVVGALALAACESHDLTRPPDPPLTHGDHVTIWVAAILAALVWTGLVIGVLAARQRLSAFRWVAGSAYIAAAVGIVGVVAFFAASDLKISEVLGSGDCREIPVEDRPHTIIQLHCDDFTGAGTALGMAYGVPAAFLSVGCALDLFHSRRPFASTGLAVVVTIGIVWGLLQASPEDDLRGGFLALLIAGALAVGGVLEIRRARNPGATPAEHAAQQRACSSRS